MESENMNNMLASVLGADKEGFESAFKAEISDRIGTKISDRTLDVAKDILQQVDGTDEVVTETYKFKSSSEVKKFITAASNAGLNKRNFKVSSNTVDITNVKDKGMTQMLQMLAKEMKATTTGRKR